MTLAGTRPPTVDEWDKYELHHRARLATKPGLACGSTDFRKQIPGLVASVTLSFKLDPYNGDYVFSFCNKKRDSIPPAFFYIIPLFGKYENRKFINFALSQSAVPARDSSQ